MKRIRIIAAFTVAAVTAGFFGTASAVSWKDFKEAAKKDFNEKVNQASGKGSSEDGAVLKVEIFSIKGSLFYVK